ncbi:uncharacterized protein LOC135115724 [Scylla paramamosain]|uniref:uncharacterized protein LOC135115724 n=1 Tax=Scylla paramamosain TaxID=85552 RepID=UPI003082B85A
MVADLKIKDVPRSLVRVPGSGRGHGAAAPAISCDLGRVSSLAATIPVNPCLPAIMIGTKMVAVSSTNYQAKNKLATVGIQGISANVSTRRPVNSEAEAEIRQGTKRARVSVDSTTTNASSCEPVGVSPGTQSNGNQERPNPTTKRRVVTARRTQPRRVLSSDYSRSIEDLLEEQRNLREENRLLQQQLAHYTRMRL